MSLFFIWFGLPGGIGAFSRPPPNGIGRALQPRPATAVATPGDFVGQPREERRVRPLDLGGAPAFGGHSKRAGHPAQCRGQIRSQRLAGGHSECAVIAS